MASQKSEVVGSANFSGTEKNERSITPPPPSQSHLWDGTLTEGAILFYRMTKTWAAAYTLDSGYFMFLRKKGDIYKLSL